MKGYIALPADPYDLQERGQCEPQQIGRMLLENYATRFLINGRRVIFTSVLVGETIVGATIAVITNMARFNLMT